MEPYDLSVQQNLWKTSSDRILHPFELEVSQFHLVNREAPNSPPSWYPGQVAISWCGVLELNATATNVATDDQREKILSATSSNIFAIKGYKEIKSYRVKINHVHS